MASKDKTGQEKAAEKKAATGKLAPLPQSDAGKSGQGEPFTAHFGGAAPKQAVTTEPEKVKAWGEGWGEDKVRIYRVGDSVLETKIGNIIPIDAEMKHRGDTVASVEFEPSSLEQRYLETGAIELVEEISRAEWDKRKADAAKGA